MRVATWNINSVRARHDRLLAWLERSDLDVVFLQETKVTDDEFPSLELSALGYEVHVHGQKSYNGVAMLSRQPVSDVVRGFDDGVEDPQARFIGGTVGGVRMYGAYFPMGGEVDSDKFTYKLDWMDRLDGFLKTHHSAEDHVLLCGDFNVAPEDRDAYDPVGWANSSLLHTDVRSRLEGLRTWGFQDLYRQHVDEDKKYSWWDYRMLAFPKRRGLRIDHVYGTAAVAASCTEAMIDRQERKGKKPSDHAPVIVTLDV